MAKQSQPGRWHRFRVIFRRCRITVLLAVLAVALGLLYLNTIGFPDFIKNPVLEKLRAHGLDLRLSRLRWRPFRGIFADNVFVGGTNTITSPQLQIKQMQLGLNYSALFKRQFQIESLTLRQGRLSMPLGASNEPPRELSIDDIQTDLELLTNDVWELDNLQAQFAGAQIRLSGALTNASSIREWTWFQGAPRPQPNDLQDRLRELADTLQQIHFAAPPDLTLDIRGDARKVQDLAVRLRIDTPGADTPWGTLSNALCFILLAPPPSNQLARAEIKLRAENAATKWGAVRNLALNGHLYSAEGNTNLLRADVDLSAYSVQIRSNRAEQIRCTAHWLHSLTNIVPLSGEAELQARSPVTEWGEARQIRLAATLETSTNAPAPDSSWAWWSKLAPYPLDLNVTASGVHSPKLDADEVSCSGQWRAPDLSIEKLTATLYGGQLDAKAKLDVASRIVSFNMTSDFDAQKISPMLTFQARNWLTNYTWNNAPQVSASGSLVLPVAVWTNRHPDWLGETRPSLRLDGQFHVADGAFRGVHALTADSHFIYSNMCWCLPDLVAMRPEGNLYLFHLNNDRTKQFYYRFASTIDPHALRPFVPPNQQRGFDMFHITEPPLVEGEVWGRWHYPDEIHATARVTATNFTVRGESVDDFESEVDYTNRVLTFIKPHLRRAGTQEMTATGASLAFDERRIFVTNGFSTADPMAVARAIGPQIENAMAPYHFSRPPTVHVNGAIPIHDERDADLHFDGDGGPFQWWRFDVSHINGKVDWVGERLFLRDINADFYLGKATGKAEFDFQKNSRAADFNFTMEATNANLHLLAMDLTGEKTNKLEGLLNAQLEITNANTADFGTWDGVGRVSLRDGLIWDIPVFGVFSPALDTIMPGLGSSRAREGSATFIMTNGVAYSDDLKIETLMARLRYWGTIDFKGAVNARMEAEMLRNTWVIGPVVSLALWPVSKTFEYHITGSLNKPDSNPVFIPKILFFPLHPFNTLKDILPEPTNSIPNPHAGAKS